MSVYSQVPRPPGFQVVEGEQLLRRDAAIQRARAALSARGYVPIETPILEHADLFLRKSGGVLSSQMYAFNSPDGANVSMRPELTAPVIRHALEDSNAPYPRRYQYASPVFRYPDGIRRGNRDGTNDPSRQFTQIGAELLGTDDPAADGEVIAAAYETALAAGATDVKVVVGNVALLLSLLDELPIDLDFNRLIPFPKIEIPSPPGVSLRQHIEHLAARQEEMETATTLRAMDIAEADAANSPANAIGRRAVDDITSRLDRKLKNSPRPPTVERHHEYVWWLSAFREEFRNLEGRYESVMSSLLPLFDAYQATEDTCPVTYAQASRLQRVVDALANEGVPQEAIHLDWTKSGEMGYYSSTVFEIRATGAGDAEVKIGGGGRYDKLASALGSGASLPALGFALNLEDALNADSGNEDERLVQPVTILARGADANDHALSEAASALRSQSARVIVAYSGIDEAASLAKAAGLDAVFVVSDADEPERVAI